MLKKTIRQDVDSRISVPSDEAFNSCYATAMKSEVIDFAGRVIRNTFYGLIILSIVAFFVACSSSMYIPNILPELESGIHEYKITSISGSGEIQNYIFDERGDVE